MSVAGEACVDSPAGAAVGEAGPCSYSTTSDGDSSVALEVPGDPSSPFASSPSSLTSPGDLSPSLSPSPNPPSLSSGIPLPTSASTKPSGMKLPSRIARPCCTPKPALPAAASPRTNGSATPTRRSAGDAITPPTRRRMPGLEDVHEEDESLSSSPEPDASSRKFSNVNAAGDEGAVVLATTVTKSQMTVRRARASSALLRSRAVLGVHSAPCRRYKASSSAGDGWASARRLGEAGVRRSSDTSVVLTEDTDSFIIGDRVWVGGTKPGKIAYIGATQFAPGEWAGVVLDDPVGKNDGSVAGIRYFQCEARRGVFSRLTRLTRTPLPGGGAMVLPGLGANGAASGTSSPSPSRPRSALVSPASSINNLSLRGGSKTGFKVGDRVIVMSSMGSKAGVLRYMGATDFAPGEWCGVELDDPLGKNDGSVAGRRYFDCQPKFGLFAPSHKVSKSPSSRRPSAACAVHHPAGVAGSNLPVMKRGSGSRESLASSVASSAVSSVRGARVRLGVTSLQKTGVRTPTTPASRASLQDTLKEKDAQIERLLQERKLDREEVVRAASQIEETEAKLIMMREEFDKYRGNADAKLRELQDLLARVQQEKSDVAGQLDDEKRKVEDLQFRFEEERITKGDIEVAHSEQAATVAALEAALAAERTRVEALERDAAALFEAAEAATRAQAVAEAAEAAARTHAADADTLRAQLERAAEGTTQLAQRATLADQEHRTAVEALLNEKETVRMELTTQLKETIAAHNEEMSALRKQIKESDESHNSQLIASNQKCSNLEEQLTSLRKQLEDAQNVIRLKSADLEKGSEASHAIENLLKGQIEEVRAAVSSTSQELATLKSASLQKDQQIEELKTSLLQAENSLKMKTLELESLIESTDQQLAEIQIKAQETGILLAQKSEELSLTTKVSEEKLSEKDSILHKMEEKCKAQESEIELVQHKLMELKQHFETSQHDMQTSNIKILEEKDIKLGQLSQSLAEKEIIVSQLQIEVSKQNTDLKEKDFLLQKHLEEITGLNEKLNSLEVTRASLSDNVQHLELEVGDLKRNLKAAEEKLSETTSQKQKLEQDIADLMSTSSDSSLQLSKLNSELREKEHELEKVKEEASINLREKEGSCQKLEQALEQAVLAQQTLEKMIDQVKKDSSDAGKMADEKLRDAESRQLQLEGELQEMQKKLVILEQEYREELNNLNHSSGAAKDEITNRLQKSEEYAIALGEELNKIKIEAQEKVDEMHQELSTLLIKLHAAEEESKMKDSLLHENEDVSKTKMAEVLQETKKFEENLKLCHQQEIESLKLHLAGMENTIAEKDVELSSVTDELSKLKQEKANMDMAISEKDSKLLEALKELQKAQELKSLADNSILEKSSDIEELNYNLTKAKQENEELEKHIIEKNTTITSLEKDLKETVSEKDRLENLIKTTETELSKVSKAFSILKEAHTLSNLSTAENEAKLQSLLQDVSDLTRVKESLQGKLRDTSEMLMDATTQLATLQEEKQLLLKVSEELETLKINFDEHKKTLSGQLEEATKEAEVVPILKEALEKEKQQNIELTEKLDAISKENHKLSEQCIKLEESSSSISVSEAQVINLEKELEVISKREEEFKLKSDSEKSELVNLLEKTQEQLAQKEKENQSRTSELSKLQEEISKTKQYQSVLEKLEKEKEELKQKVSVMTVNVAESEANANSSDSSYVKLIEEKELAQSQIDFLNSVIVDMQQKNVALKTRLEVLEMGILPSDASDLIEEGITRKVLAPRLFCDICDEFDLHDTEDCPRQATGSPTPPTSNQKRAVGSRSNIQDRPYCDICEIKIQGATGIVVQVLACANSVFQIIHHMQNVLGLPSVPF